MQFHTENEILMCTYSYLHSRVFQTIITLLFMQYILYEPYPQLRHKIKMAAIEGDFVQTAYGEVIVSL